MAGKLTLARAATKTFCNVVGHVHNAVGSTVEIVFKIGDWVNELHRDVL